MTKSAWRLVEVLSLQLTPAEREVALGDLIEARTSAWRGAREILGLVVRRQLQLWRSWQPWMAVFGLALPGSLLLMGFSVSVSSIYENLVDRRILIGSPHSSHEAVFQLLCRGLLLIAGSWVGGFVLGSVSRRTLGLSIVSSCFPCFFCLLRFREPSLSRLCLFLFLLPAIWGVREALRLTRINLAPALFLAIAITTLTILPIDSRGALCLNWSLVWPAWYIVAAAVYEGRKDGSRLKLQTR